MYYSHLLLNREEELMYLEFISAVTEDILSRGHISDRSVDVSMWMALSSSSIFEEDKY